MNAVCLLIYVYVACLWGRVILSWFPVAEGSGIAGVYSFLYTITEPLLGPVRRMLPPVGVGGMGLDLSPMIVTLVLQLVVPRLLGC